MSSPGRTWNRYTVLVNSTTNNLIPLNFLSLHLLPTHIPFDICSACSEPVLPAHAQFERIQVVALCRVLLRYVFCSHKCLTGVVEQWEVERIKETAKKRTPENRFQVKEREG